MQEKTLNRISLFFSGFFILACAIQITYFLLHISEETNYIDLVIKCVVAVIYVACAIGIGISAYHDNCSGSRFTLRDLGYKPIVFASMTNASKGSFISYLYVELKIDGNVSNSFINSDDYDDIAAAIYDDFYKPECSIWYRQINDRGKVMRFKKKFKSYKDTMDCVEWQVSRSNIFSFPEKHYRIYIDLVEKDKSAILNMLG